MKRISATVLSVCFTVIALAVITIVFIGQASAGQTFSPWALCPDSDSNSIEANRALAEYRSLDLPRSDVGLSYIGSTLWTVTLDVEIHGTSALMTGMNGLMIFDVADPANPVLVNKIPLDFLGSYSLSCLDGDVLYIGGSSRVYIFDVSDPVNPLLLRELYPDGTVWEIEVHDNRLYAGIARSSSEYTDTPALYIYDITDPSDPVIIGKYEPPSIRKDCRTIELVGDYVYGVNTWDHQIDIIDISDETAPARVGYLEVTYPNDLLYDRGYLYVIEWYDMMKIYDLAVPESPVLVDSLEVNYVRTMKMHDNNLYATQKLGDDNGVAVYSVTEPGEPVYQDFMPCRTHWYGLTIEDSLLFFSESTFGFTVIDISSPYDLEKIKTYSHPIHYLAEFEVSDNYAYLIDELSVSGETRDGWYVVDISDKQNPELVYSYNNYCLSSGVTVSDSLLFVSGCWATRIMSLADPASPVELSHYPEDIHSTTNKTAFRNSVLYISRGHDLLSVDISNPSNPLLLSEVNTGSYIMENVILHGNLAYVAARTWSGELYGAYLVVVDITDPSEMVLVDTALVALETGYYYWPETQICMRGDYIYYGGGNTGMSVVDIRDGERPDVVYNYCSPGGRYYGVDTKRNVLFVLTSYALQVYDITDPTTPELLDYIRMANDPRRLQVDGDFLYVMGRWGFYIYELDLPPGICGDANGSTTVDIDDVVWLISYIFVGGEEPDPYESGDANCSGVVGIDDVVYLISYVFIGGYAPCDIDGDDVPDC